ncbi:hypothetical protein DB346_02770 [Verrucomicrobia bacterium LW23]|nr:hypothetical protein DB346_03885 [Verrucomicrobia bacterium LW23]PTY04371.1 hypothetical protein DB346_02770 [Verrucomicrobia bacterium LW23]
MARKQIPRELPAPEQVFREFTGFPQDASKQFVLLTELRKAAKKLKKRQPIPFYSMREIADHFGTPLRTVALAYETLEREGILNCIRSSHTMLVGKTQAPRSPVRAVVGIPIWLHSLVVSPYARTLHMSFEELLRENGFVADMVFFNENEAIEPGFAQRLLHHNLDMAIWHTPHPLGLNVLLSLKDSGVQQVAIQHTDSPTSIPVPTYWMDWVSAYYRLAKNWQDSGIERVIVPDPVYLPSKRALKNFINVLTQHKLEVEMAECSAHSIMEKAAFTRRKVPTAVAFVDQQGADSICSEDPVLIEEIIRLAARVGFCRGPIRLPYFNHRPASVDVVGFRAREVAERVVTDLVRGIDAGNGNIHTFYANYDPQVSFNRQTETL